MKASSDKINNKVYRTIYLYKVNEDICDGAYLSQTSLSRRMLLINLLEIKYSKEDILKNHCL